MGSEKCFRYYIWPIQGKVQGDQGREEEDEAICGGLQEFHTDFLQVEMPCHIA